MQKGLLLFALLTSALLARAGTSLLPEQAAKARAAAPETARQAARAAAGGFAVSTLQVGCEGAAGSACRRATTDVEVGDISQINQASGGTAIQEALIGTAR